MFNVSKKKSKDYSWSTIIPLIGGFPIGVQNQIGVPPTQIFSYKDVFQFNDQNYVNYIQETQGLDVPYIDILNDGIKPEQVDAVFSVCPCAGLSRLNVKSSSDAESNEWMLKSSEFILSEVKPKLLVGENAPALATSIGAKFLEKMRKLGAKYGYSISLYKTSSVLHGSNQTRRRSYFFYHKGPALKIPKYRRDPMIFEEQIFRPMTRNIDPMYDILTNNGDPYEHDMVKMLLEIFKTDKIHDVYENIEESINIYAYLLNNHRLFIEGKYGNGLPEYLEKQFRRAYSKIDAGMGCWLHGSPMIVRTDKKPTYGTFVAGLQATTINHKEDRYMNFREALRCMGMPENFDMVDTSNSNVICQNVCTEVSQDIGDACSQIINDNYGLVDADFYVTDNHHGYVEKNDLNLI